MGQNRCEKLHQSVLQRSEGALLRVWPDSYFFLRISHMRKRRRNLFSPPPFFGNSINPSDGITFSFPQYFSLGFTTVIESYP